MSYDNKWLSTILSNEKTVERLGNHDGYKY